MNDKSTFHCFITSQNLQVMFNWSLKTVHKKITINNACNCLQRTGMLKTVNVCMVTMAWSYKKFYMKNARVDITITLCTYWNVHNNKRKDNKGHVQNFT